MYTRSEFEESRKEVLHDLMRARPFATLVTVVNSAIVVDHLPFVLDSTRGEFGTLRGHVARANPVWQALSGGVESVIVFQGPQAYISPSWYASQHAHGRVVPTWNYAVVHAHGYPRCVEDEAWLLEHVTALTARQESGEALPWKVSDAPSDYVAQLLRAIVGIEMQIARIVGKWKVSQNRPAADRRGVAAGLGSRDDRESREMAELVMERVNRP